MVCRKSYKTSQKQEVVSADTGLYFSGGTKQVYENNQRVSQLAMLKSCVLSQAVTRQGSLRGLFRMQALGVEGGNTGLSSTQGRKWGFEKPSNGKGEKQALGVEVVRWKETGWHGLEGHGEGEAEWKGDATA